MVEKRQPASYHIGAVAKLTGVSTHALRVWERRYAAVTPQRSPGGTRVYSEADITRLRTLKQLTRRGHAIGTIAGLPLSQLQPLLGPSAPVETQDTREARAVAEFVAAIKALDLATAEQVLIEANGLLDPLSFVFDVIAPSLQAIGEEWAKGTLRIGHEHAATSLLRSFFGVFMRGRSLPSHAPVAVATTLADEFHEFGALMAAFVARVRGWQVIYLGPNMPAGEIIYVLEQTGAALLLLSLVNPHSDDNAAQVRTLVDGLPPATHVLVGGRSAALYAELTEPQRVTSQAVFDRTLRQLHARTREKFHMKS